MAFVASILFAACVLPSVMGLTLNTPADSPEDGNIFVTWTPAATDPKFSILLVGAESFDIAQGIAPDLGNTTVAIGGVTPGQYTLQAFNADDFEDVLSTSKPFAITPAGTAPPAAAAPPAPPPPAAAPPATASAGGPPFDPAGVPNVGNGVGKQFIGGQCLNAADCASGCCAGPSGICSGPGAQLEAGKTGCGFVSGAASGAAPAAAPSPPVAAAPATAAAGGPPFDPAGVPNVGNGVGKQFIGGQCLAAADCASGCCAGPSGICSGVGAQTQAGKTGCGFVSKRFVNRKRSLLM